MNCNLVDRISASRAILARLVAVLIALQAFIPGVLAYSTDDESIWCLSLAPSGQADHSTPPTSETCVICLVMAAGNAPVPAAPPVVLMTAKVELVRTQPRAVAAQLPVAAGASPPIRAPPFALPSAVPGLLC